MKTDLKIAVAHAVDREVLWFSCGGEPQQTLRHQYDKMTYHGVNYLCLAAVPANSSLIVDAWHRKFRGEIVDVLLLGPNFLHADFGAMTPEQVSKLLTDSASDYLHAQDRRRARPCPSSTLGYWHPIQSSEVLAYRLAEVGLDDDAVEQRIALIQQHPAFPAWSFVAPLNIDALAKLVGMIRDPRWYVDRENPDRISKLSAYLGIRPKTVQRAISRKILSGAAVRYATLVDVWYGNVEIGDLSQPGAWFLRRLLDAGDSDNETVKLCRRFLAFVRDAWLQSLYPGNSELFVPQIHFDEETASAFTAHISALS